MIGVGKRYRFKHSATEENVLGIILADNQIKIGVQTLPDQRQFNRFARLTQAQVQDVHFARIE